MIEIRKLVEPDWYQYGETGRAKRMKGETKDQYRYVIHTSDASGHLCGGQWSEWIDVPTVYEDDHDIEDT